MLATVWQLLFSIFPAWFAIGLLAFITFLVVVLVLKIIKVVLDAIPFV